MQKIKFCMIDFEGMLEEGVELISQDYIFKDIELGILRIAEP